MRKWVIGVLVMLPLVAGGLVYATSTTDIANPVSTSAEGYVCPLTGETLPCPSCCPLNQTKSASVVSNPQATSSGYVCPITGETLPCPGCCPLNQVPK
jgi:hypothetical protein